MAEAARKNKRLLMEAMISTFNPNFRAIVDKEKYQKEIIFAHGGDTRQHSVLNAFKAAFSGRKKTGLVAIHDAARPLVTQEYFENALALAEKYGNAVCAARARDTFKRSDSKDLIKEAVDRENLWQILLERHSPETTLPFRPPQLSGSHCRNGNE